MWTVEWAGRDAAAEVICCGSYVRLRVHVLYLGVIRNSEDVVIGGVHTLSRTQKLKRGSTPPSELNVKQGIEGSMLASNLLSMLRGMAVDCPMLDTNVEYWY